MRYWIPVRILFVDTPHRIESSSVWRVAAAAKTRSPRAKVTTIDVVLTVGALLACLIAVRWFFGL